MRHVGDDEACDAVAAAQDCERRALEREGVPVLLALEDLRTEPIHGRDEAARAQGARFAELLGRYAAELVPDARDGDAQALYSVLAVIGYCHVSGARRSWR